MYSKFIFLVIFSFLSTVTFAHSFRDSIGVENLSGKKVILYKLEPKDNYYSISRKYGVSPKIVMDFNKNIALQIGSIIKIPTSINFETSPVTTLPRQESTATQTLHTVAAKETLYAISALYGMKMEDLKKLNNLKSNALSIGKVLKVIKNNTQGIDDHIKETEKTVTKDKLKVEDKLAETTPKDSPKTETIDEDKTVIADIDSPTKEIPTNKYGITEMHEKGTAVWIDDKNLDSSKSYALHRTAPVGTVVKISNPMSGRSVFAKVVGKYTENETTKDVIIVVTKAAAEAIGVIDKRFFVNIGYGIPSNEK
ncbi:MAG: LysM peptidoglycan-binding domain-containing protein [Sphingobacteriales bacterium]|nr:MAG: LysM peptidoglycan-binding domain-containing protein [Sphingobacteriales bacterium]TAF79169.1 MAG: LysM peptidoglycan-binding domain-containing protein [Sphingobacteriales bacterium]